MVGMLAIFTAIASTLCDSGLAVSLINKKEIRFEDLNAVFWFSMTVATICYLALFIGAPLIAKFYHQPALISLSRWSFLSFVIASLGIAPSANLSKKLKVKEKSIAEITALGLSGILGVYLAYKGHSYWSIVIQTIVFVAIKSGLYWFFDDWKPSFHIDFSPVKEMLYFSIKLVITSLAIIFNTYIFSVIFGRLYSEKEVGYYNQANKWNTMGSSMVTGMIHSVAQPVLVESRGDDVRQLRVFRKMVRFTSFLSFPLMFGLSFVAPEFITIAITDKWLPSANILRILAISGAFAPLGSLFTYLILSRNDSSSYMWANLALIAVLLITVAFIHPYGIMGMIIAYSIINILWLGVWFVLVRRKIGYTFGQLIRDVAPYLGITSLIIVGVYFLTAGIDNIYISITVKILAVAVAYIIIMWLSRSVTFRESAQYILQKLNIKSKKETI